MIIIEKISSQDTGGGEMVDIVHLKDGRCLGITNESVVLCKNFEDVFVATGESPAISLIQPFKRSVASHTPGPWAFEMFAVGDMAEMQWLSQDSNYYGDDGKSICLIAGHEWKHPDNDKRKGKRHYLTEESVANARLIAAAPELLQALVFCLSFLTANDDGEDDVVERIKAAKTAIAKATGGQS